MWEHMSEQLLTNTDAKCVHDYICKRYIHIIIYKIRWYIIRIDFETHSLIFPLMELCGMSTEFQTFFNNFMCVLNLYRLQFGSGKVFAFFQFYRFFFLARIAWNGLEMLVTLRFCFMRKKISIYQPKLSNFFYCYFYSTHFITMIS